MLVEISKWIFSFCGLLWSTLQLSRLSSAIKTLFCGSRGDFEICSNVREISHLSFDDRFHCIFFQPRYQGFSLEGKSPGNEVDILQFCVEIEVNSWYLLWSVPSGLFHTKTQRQNNEVYKEKFIYLFIFNKFIYVIFSRRKIISRLGGGVVPSHDFHWLKTFVSVMRVIVTASFNTFFFFVSTSFVNLRVRARRIWTK